MLFSRITEFLSDRAISALETATVYWNRFLRFGLPAATIMLAAAFTCAQPLQAASARKLVQEGNQAYGEGKYDEALKSYEQAAEEEPGSPRIPFNKGAALYRQGDYSKALDEFQKAAAAGSVAEDRELEARAHSNAGNSFVRMSEQQKAAPRGALDLLGRGVDAYRRALQLDPALTDAAHNLEVARMQMKQLLEQAQRNQQGGQGQQDSQNQDLPQQLQDLLNQQQQASNEGEKLSEQQQQQGDSQQLQEQSQKLSEKQQDIQQQTEQLARQMEQQQQQQQKQSQGKQPQPPQQQEIQKNLDEASSRQQQAQQKIEQKQLSAANEDQKKAEEALRQALDAAKGKPGAQTQEQQQAQAQPQPEEPPQQPETPSEAPESEQVTEGQGDEAPNEAARDILDEERANRKQRQIRQMKGTRPVEKDW
jgi:Ca-activated chloride channel family protein